MRMISIEQLVGGEDEGLSNNADLVQGKQSGSWSGDGLSQQLQQLGLRIVKVEPDGAATAGIL